MPAQPKIVLFKNSGSTDYGYLTFYVKKTPIQVLFQGIPNNLSDARAASYQPMNIAKRTEPLLIYQWTEFREVKFDLEFGVLSGPQDAYDMYALASLLRRSVFPSKRGVPMYARVNLGPFFINFAVEPQGNNYILMPDSYTDTSEGMTCQILSQSIVPSAERCTDEALKQITSPPGWWNMAPMHMSVSLDVKVFAQQVWSAGTMSMPPSQDLQGDERATTLPDLDVAARTPGNNGGGEGSPDATDDTGRQASLVDDGGLAAWEAPFGGQSQPSEGTAATTPAYSPVTTPSPAAPPDFPPAPGQTTGTGSTGGLTGG